MRHVAALLVICGLRDYGLPPSVWGDREDCAHEWGAELPSTTVQPARDCSGGFLCTDGRPNPKDFGTRGEQPTSRAMGGTRSHGQFCRLCGCWKGALGLEPTPDLYVQHMVEVMREVKRVLRDDGCMFLNLGDSYAQASSRKGQSNSDHTYEHANTAFRDERYSGGVNISAKSAGVKPKDLIGIPWMVAFALRDDGWYLRSDIIWAKGLSFCPTYSGSVMPESCKDRPTSAYEHVFLLAKNKRYYYDGEAVKETCGTNTHSRGTPHTLPKAVEPGQGNRFNTSWEEATWGSVSSRNLRNVWAIPDTLTEFFKFCESHGVDLDALAEAYVDGQRDVKDVFCINPKGFKQAHFATFCPELITPMIKAGTSERGCCPECGAGWIRCKGGQNVVEYRYENETMQGMPRTQTLGSVSPTQSENVQCVCSEETKGAQTSKLGTRAGNVEVISGDAPGTRDGTQAQVLCDGAGQGIDAGAGARVPAYGKGQEKLTEEVCTVGEDGKGKTEQSNPMRPKAGAITESTGNLHGGGLGSDSGKTGTSLSVLRGTVHREQARDDRSRDASIEGRSTQSREHSCGVPVLQLEEMESATGRIVPGWRPGCQCYVRQLAGVDLTLPPEKQDLRVRRALCGEPITVPCRVLDPFGGSGTTALVARQLGRDAILIELNPDYCEMARRRLDGTQEVETIDHTGEQVTMEQATMFSSVVL